MVVARWTSIGVYLSDGESDVLLPRAEAGTLEVGDTVEAFVYLDSEDRPIATLRKPKAQDGEIASLKVQSVEPAGVFLDWGLERDLFLPYRELRSRPVVGDRLLVHVHLDEKSGRMVASERIRRHLEEFCPLPIGEEVQATLWRRYEGNLFMIVNGKYSAIAAEGAFIDSRLGTTVTAYVVRSHEGKITLGQRPPGASGLDALCEKIVATAKRSGGFVGLSDKSAPEEIRRAFGVSKGDYKKAIGMLMKRGLIDVEHFGVRLKS